MTTEKERNLFRIDIYRTDEHPARRETHGWQVRFKRKSQGNVTKFFSDAHYGGPAGARLAALAWRDEQLRHLPGPEDGLKIGLQNRSKTGVPGVRIARKDGKLYVEATWIDAAGRRRVKACPIHRGGVRRAVWNACLAKARGEGTIGSAELQQMFSRVFLYAEQTLSRRLLSEA